MGKITFTDKQTATDPASPQPNETFTAENANEVKSSVNFLYEIVDFEPIEYVQPDSQGVLNI